MAVACKLVAAELLHDAEQLSPAFSKLCHQPFLFLAS